MSYVQLYSNTGVVETSPFLEIVVDGNALGSVFMNRLEDLEIKLCRRKRPKAELNFSFESFFVETDGQRKNSSDITIDTLPLDSKVSFKLGYRNEFKTFGPFEVVEHNVSFTEGGVQASIDLEGFGIVRNAADYRVYTTGSVLDIISEVYQRNGIIIKDTKIKQVINQLEAYVASDNAEASFAAREILKVDPEDPFVQVGESDERFIRRISSHFGFSPQMTTSGKEGVEFATLFFTDKGKKINLRHAVEYPNVKSFTFKSSKTRTSYLRNPPKDSKLESNVPKRGKQESKGDDVAEQKSTPARTEGKEEVTSAKGTVRKQLTREEKLKKWRNTEDSPRTSVGPEIVEDPAEPVQSPSVTKNEESPKANATDTKTNQVEQPSTKQENKNRKLGKIIGRRRRAGRILEISANLISGSVTPNLGMAVVFDVPSDYHRGNYVIDKITHSFNTEGFDSKLELVRPRRKKKKGKGKSDKANTETRAASEEELNGEVTSVTATTKSASTETSAEKASKKSEQEVDGDGKAVRK